MNCKKCGSHLEENDQFCRNCGETVNSQSTNMGGQTSMNMQNTNNTNAQPMNATQPNNLNNMNNGQQGMPNYNNAPMNNNQPMNKPSGSGKFIVIGLAIFAVIVVIIIVAFVVLGMILKKVDNNGLTSGGSSNVIQTNKTNYKVAFKGFTFEIPDNLIYKDNGRTLTIGNEEGTWATVLEVEQGSFAQLKSRKSQLQSVMQKNGYTASMATEKNLGGVEFITMEISTSGQNAIAALTKANSMYIIGVTALNQDNEFDYKLLEKVAPIVKSAQYEGTSTNNINGNSKIDMSAISELAK